MQDDPFDIETDTDIAAPAELEQALINRIIEAALLASAQPMTALQLSALFPDERPVPDQSIKHALEALAAACAERGVELVEVASGYRYQVKAEVHGWVSRMWTERKTRYTRATLETLALIAYRQPITRGEIEQVRGVAVSSNIIQALEEREWIRVVGHRDVPGKPALFGTTRGFLDYFGLKRLDELPPLSELKEIGELDPQLPFGGAPLAAKAAAEGQPADDSDIQDRAPPSDADSSDTTDLTHDNAEDDAEDLHDQAGGSDSDIMPADAEVPEIPDDDALADIADHAAPDTSGDDTAPHDSTTSQQPQEDDAEPVSSEQKP